jgi:hypothetical protein
VEVGHSHNDGLIVTLLVRVQLLPRINRTNTSCSCSALPYLVLQTL